MEAEQGEQAQPPPSKAISSSPSVSTVMPMRFVRLNPRFDRQEALRVLQSEIKSSRPDRKYPISVPWLHSPQHQVEFFAIPGEFCLNKSSSFQSGRVYGMDVTSGAAVAALLLKVFDQADSPGLNNHGHEGREENVPLRVLDLCCAPGLKLCMISDLVPENSLVVGVDASKSRLSLCKNIIKKYHIDATTSESTLPKNNEINQSEPQMLPQLKREFHSDVKIRLYCADGTTFGTHTQSTSMPELIFDSTLAYEEHKTRGKRKRMNKSARSREKRRLLGLESQGNNINGSSTTITIADQETSSIESKNETISVDKESGRYFMPPFDRVLVDAECSSDGAIRHMQKRQSSSSSRRPTWDDSNMNELIDLQKRLIDSGFRLLKSGGILVYSTCSLSTRQNEDVVDWLLKRYNNAFIIPLSFLQHSEVIGASLSDLQFMQEGAISGTVRFNPHVKSADDDCVLAGGGFFIAKLGKRH